MTNMENGEAIISGYLWKSPPESKLRNLKSWTKRYFVLYKNRQLCYFKTEKEKKPIKDPIKLSQCKLIESNLNHEKFNFVFSIVTDKRTYYLVADTQHDMETWVEKLCSACGFQRNQSLRSPDSKASPKTSEYSSSQARPQPIANKARSPVGTPSSVPSSGSSLTSPTGPCPLSIPKHIMDSQNKIRSMSDPPEHPSEAPQVPHGQFRRQSEQAVSSMLPAGLQNKARLSGNISENYNVVPSPRPLSGEVYDNLPSSKKVSNAVSSSGLEKRLESGKQESPRALDHASSPSPPTENSGHHLSPNDYDQVPTPRPISQDVYDIVPPPRPTPSCSQDGQRCKQENYDILPPPRPMSSGSEEGDQSLYDFPPTGKENYDIVPPISRPVAPKPSHLQSDSSNQNYDVVPMRQSIYDIPPGGRTLEQDNYDIVPPHRPLAAKPGASQDNYDVVPKRQASHLAYNGQSAGDVLPFGRPLEQENYDIVPPIHRPVGPINQQGTSDENYDVVPMRQTLHSAYDNLPSERASTQENYDIVPPVQRPVSMKPSHMQPYSSQETYDVVPIPRPSDENYDFVPTPRAISTADQPENLTSNHNNGFASFTEQDHQSSDIYSVPPNSNFRDSREWVPSPQRPTPYRPRQDGYDPLPNTNRPVSADSGLNASFTSICSLKSEGDCGHEDRYDAPLPDLPSHTRDSGSLSDEMPDDDINPSDIYDKPPNWDSRNSIYDVPPKQESNYDVLPNHPNEIYDTASMTSDEIYDVPPNREQGLPVVDRSTKRPPVVNRAIKPKTLTEDHSYCNIPPKVDRESKKRGMMLQPEHSYINMGVPPPRPKHLPLVKILTESPFTGSLPNQPTQWSTGPADDSDYCPMKPPTRSEMTRCYSLTKDEKPRSRSPGNDQCYEDMSAVQTRRYSGAKSTSSSSSSLADNDDLYMPMVPNHHGSSPSQLEQRHRKDLLYAEVEILEGAHNVKTSVPTPPRRENTHYTYINEESTRALLQTSHARQGNR